MTEKPQEKQRQRAPSQRSLQTRARILDAAEQVFAEKGFDAASIRDIAGKADVQVGLVNHHGGSKEALFQTIVARRADVLSGLRLEALGCCKCCDPQTILRAFVAPFFQQADAGPEWRAYARIIAHVSADPRWHALAEEWLDPTAGKFIAAICELYPDAPRSQVASGFVFTVSSMLALITSGWRFDTLGGENRETQARIDDLIRFCAAGIEAAAKGAN